MSVTRLKIPVKVMAAQIAGVKVAILVSGKVREVEYAIEGEYVDDSKSILEEFNVGEEEEDEDVNSVADDVEIQVCE